ncbi:aryl-alcohol dehydrogenase-like predicted oxidoreductase [Motilibacter rhizosphaerae]|uniref:Aryl-alcohol dehydrogenase-like predicted oxidoreductase n=1 Tax=Motilibacter rhizosphaerae TaxID=598652 RepID=A0A4Q7NAS6_9ACTN|nr:aldo/keto reductase [Motilibacter rhizosphaerae]RZS80048.1 aryl-alcohol dehydrogenase-like predicted oxidoreductase [Motilibacter rhizosphaerae]
MEQRQVGRSGLRVSRLGLGTLTWGRDTDELDAADLARAFLDAGGTLVETSPAYGEGAAEAVLGALLAGRVPRDDVLLVTRAGGADRSRRGLLASLDASLQRLGTPDVDLLLLDGWDSRVPLDEALAAADAAVASGRAAYVGLAGCTGWQVARSVTWQEALRRAPLVAAAVPWSLAEREAEQDVVPASAELGLGVLGGAALGGGVLTGKYRHGVPSDSRAASTHLAERVEPLLRGRPRSVVDALATAAEGLGVPPLTAALGWLWSRPELASAVVGPRTPQQLRAVLAADAAAPLPGAIVAALDDVSAP